MKDTETIVTFIRKGANYSRETPEKNETGFKRSKAESAGFLIEDTEDSVFVPLGKLVTAFFEANPYPRGFVEMVKRRLGL